jgi:hypothetical protein
VTFPFGARVTTITLDIPSAVMRRAHMLYVKYGPEHMPWTIKANAQTLACFREGYPVATLRWVETDLGRFDLDCDEDMPTGYVLLCDRRVAVLIGPEDGVVSTTE